MAMTLKEKLAKTPCVHSDSMSSCAFGCADNWDEDTSGGGGEENDLETISIYTCSDCEKYVFESECGCNHDCPACVDARDNRASAVPCRSCGVKTTVRGGFCGQCTC